MVILECQDLCKDYGPKKVIKNVNLTIERGKVVGLLGPNGSGKTTIIKLINDLLVPTSGKVLINGMEPGIETKKIISYLPERTYLSFNMKVVELIKFFKDFYDDFDENKALKLLKQLKINANDKLKTMSKGMKEKVQLVLVMSRKASLYILDEPIGGVDPATRDYILKTIMDNFNDDSTIIISTHLISDVEKILDDVIFIADGKIKLTAGADELRKERNASIDEIFREEFKC